MILNLVNQEEKHQYYYERGLIYEKIMFDKNSINYADLAISDFNSAIDLNPNIAEYFKFRGNCWSLEGMF